MKEVMRRAHCGVAIILLAVWSVPLTGQVNIQLLGQTAIPGGFVTDVWGYTDPVTSREYALVGTYGSVHVIDVTNPAVPTIVSSIMMPGFDVKVWQHYVFGVTGSGGANQGKIADITVPSSPQVVGSFSSSHNITITDNGYLFAESPGLKVYNLNPDPLHPVLVWDDGTSGGHDASFVDGLLYDFHGNQTNIYSVNFTGTFSLQLLGSITDPQIAYHHSGWTSQGGRFLLICDEGAQHPTPDITAWNIENPATPVRVGAFADPTATVHNLFVIGRYAYVSYYTAGFRVLDVSDPASIQKAAEYDTSPDSGEGFDGAFGVYPFSPSGHIFISDQTGLYVFSVDTIATGAEYLPDEAPTGFFLSQNYPNPFNPSTTIRFEVPERSHVTITVTDIVGRFVARPVDGDYETGSYRVTFSFGDLAASRSIASGTYFYTLQTPKFRTTKKFLYLE